MNPATIRAEFAEFAQARQHHLMRTAYLLCGSWEGAEDLTQTALYHLCRAWGRARRADSVDAYAHRTLINAYLAQQRSSKRERATRVDVDPATVADLAARPDSTDLRVTLLAALAELPPRARAVVVLRFWEDLSVEATAAALRCTTGTVKSQTSRGLARLREVLGASFSPSSTSSALTTSSEGN